jgi:hypothetical protein
MNLGNLFHRFVAPVLALELIPLLDPTDWGEHPVCPPSGPLSFRMHS